MNILALCFVFAIFVFSVSSLACELRRSPISTKLEKLAVLRATTGENGGFLRKVLPGSYLRRLEDKFKILGTFKLAGFKIDDPIMFVTSRALITLIVLMIALMVGTFSRNWLVILFSLVSWFFPGYLLESSLRRRKGRISKEIPDFISAIKVCLSSGLSMDEALLEISMKYDGDIYGLLRKAMIDVEMGKDKREVLRDFASKSGVDELKMLIKSIIFAQNSGADINNVMESVSEGVVEQRRLKNYVRGQRSPILVIGIIIVFIVPPTLTLMFMPVLLNLRNL